MPTPQKIPSSLLRNPECRVLGYGEAYERYGIHSRGARFGAPKTYTDFSGGTPEKKSIRLGSPFDSLHILKLRNVYVADNIGVFTEDGCLLHPFYAGKFNGVFVSHEHPDNKTATLSRHSLNVLANASVAVAAEPFFLCNATFSHYGHFVLECLPRLWAMEHLHPKPTLFINDPDFGYDICLEALGHEVKYAWAGEKVVFVPELYAATQPFFIGHYCTEEARSIWTAIGAYHTASLPAAGVGIEKLYLSRRNIRFNRVLQNELFLENLFRRRGFTPIMPENLSFLEQLVLFSNASAIAAPYGSAIFSALFSPKPSAMFLLSPSEAYLHHLACFGDTADIGVFLGEKTGPLNEQYPEIASYIWRIADDAALLSRFDEWSASLPPCGSRRA